MRKTVAPASALVTVTVLSAAGGVINWPGDAVAEGMTMSLQSGSGTAGTDCVGCGVGGRVVLTACAHPAAIVITATPTSVDRRIDAICLTVSTLRACARFLEMTHLLERSDSVGVGGAPLRAATWAAA